MIGHFTSQAPRWVDGWQLTTISSQRNLPEKKKRVAREEIYKFQSNSIMSNCNQVQACDVIHLKGDLSLESM